MSQISDLHSKESLRVLIEHVMAHQNQTIPSISYQDLAARVGRVTWEGKAHAHGMGGIILKRVGYLLKDYRIGWGEKPPDIQCLVGEKKGDEVGLPADGISEFWPEYRHLTLLEKERRVSLEKERVSKFGSRWNHVLQRHGFPHLVPASYFGSGGESSAHKALKEFVKNNPAYVGVCPEAKPETEYVLPSLDTIDVLFKDKINRSWTAVEVKSKVSDGTKGDYERGVYQVVKYAAILNAMRSDSRNLVPPAIRVVLVLETSLPIELKALADRLKIEVVENLDPAASIPG